MKESRENGEFHYTYSAKEQEELRKIREKYEPREEDKMERLRRLDKGVTRKAQIIALTVGILGTLILGVGMSLAMSDFAVILGTYQNLAMPIGIVIGLCGGVLASLAHPIYGLILKRERKKIAPEILMLTKELMK